MDEKFKKLKEIIDGSDNIVFFGGAGVSTEVVFRILEVWTDYTIRNMIIHRKQF